MLRRVLTRVHSYVLQGIDAVLCEVEVDVTQRGTSKVHLVGLPQAAMKESIERIRRALINSGFPFPSHQVAINLAPADLKKEAAALDLPVAVGLLRSMGAINTDKHKSYLMAGELALDGRLRKIKGALSLAMLAKQKKFDAVILPAENAREAAVVEGVTVYPCSNLGEVTALLNDQLPVEPFELNGDAYQATRFLPTLDFVDVRGQEAVKRAVTVACAGAHNILMS